MDYTKLAALIDELITRRMRSNAPHIRLGTVVGAETASVSVRIDGSENPTSMPRCCACAAGDRVVVLRQETQFYCIGKVGA